MSLNELIKLIKKYFRVLIVYSTIISLISSIVVFMAFPLTYKSSVKILPPEKNSSSPLNNLLGGSEMSSFLDFTSSGTSQLFAEILKSRTASELVVSKLSLLEYFDYKELQSAVKKVQKLLEVNVSKEGIVEISFKLKTGFFGRFSSNDETRKMVSDIANQYSYALDKINTDKMNSKAKRSRMFVQGQISEAKNELRTAEEKLKTFQELNKTISLDEQIKSAIENAAKLKAEIVFNEIELKKIESNHSIDSQTYISVKKKLDILKTEYAKFNIDEKNKDYFPSFDLVPGLSLNYARLLRDVKVKSEVLVLLEKQFYKEKIQENRDIPTLEILDNAIPPMKEESPKMLTFALGSWLTAFSIILVYLIFGENKKNKRIN